MANVNRLKHELACLETNFNKIDVSRTNFVMESEDDGTKVVMEESRYEEIDETREIYQDLDKSSFMGFKRSPPTKKPKKKALNYNNQVMNSRNSPLRVSSTST